MSNTITTTDFNFPNQKSVYRGKVREVYNINDELLVMVATDRLSAFDTEASGNGAFLPVRRQTGKIFS